MVFCGKNPFFILFFRKLNIGVTLMRVFLISIITLFFLSIILQSCGTTQETTKESGDDEVYVFDEIPEENIINIYDPETDPPYTGMKYFIVQIGAFTTKEKAENFAKTSRSKLNKEIEISYSNRVNLFVVHIKPFFTDRSDAEKLRNELWRLPDYNDAWILTVIK